MVDAVSKKVIAEMTSKIALRRLGRVEDVANLIIFLASNDQVDTLLASLSNVVECFEYNICHTYQ